MSIDHSLLQYSKRVSYKSDLVFCNIALISYILLKETELVVTGSVVLYFKVILMTAYKPIPLHLAEFI